MTAIHMPATKLGFSPISNEDPHNPSLAETRGPSPPVNPFFPSQNTSSSDLATEFDLDSVPRSASYTQLAAVNGPDTSFERNGVKRTFSENFIANPKTNTFRHSSIKKGSKQNKDLNRQQEQDEQSTSLSSSSKPGPTITVSGFQVGPDEDEADVTPQPVSKSSGRAAGSAFKTRSVSGSLARLKRQSWIASSRSPSPSKRKPLEQRPDTSDGKLNRRSPSLLQAASAASTDASNSTITSNGHDSARAGRYGVQRKKSRRRISSYLSMTSLSDASPKDPIIPKSYSTDKLPLSHTHTSSEIPPSLPSSKSFERLSAASTESPRRKDDLWSAFRALDADFQKYMHYPIDNESDR
ncbi:MAG: hypothetical protein Q9195_002084 [Heterodermia aff. obscurata]